MEEWKFFVDNQVKLIIKDGELIRKKIGKCLAATPTHIIINREGKKEAINLSTVIRIEEVQE